MIPIDAPPITVANFLRQSYDDAEYWRKRKPNGTSYTVQDVSGRRAHCGYDMTSTDRILQAVCEGRAEYVDFGPDYGIQTVVRHASGSGAFYAHQERRLVNDGAAVRPGQDVGVMGTTGGVRRHLHFSVTQRWDIARFENCGPQLRALKAELMGGDAELNQSEKDWIERLVKGGVRLLSEGGSSGEYNPAAGGENAWIPSAQAVALNKIVSRLDRIDQRLAALEQKP